MREKPMSVQYRCYLCWNQISKWNRPVGICKRCLKYGKPQNGGMDRKRSDAFTGSNNRKWMGNEVSYAAVHAWIGRELGKATYCAND